jgi:MerR family transcriptional regulator, light-induced transcriptional regulator
MCGGVEKMTDVNEQSFSAVTATDVVNAHQRSPRRQHIPAPIWRFRPTLPPISVVKTIKTQIIPKIVLALRKAPVASSEESAQQQNHSPVERFAALALASNDDAPFAYIEDLLGQGVSAESIFLDLLAPTARHFGSLWESDATDFASVTLAMSRLQRIMRRLGERFFDKAGQGSGEAVLLTIVPGEQHSFGLSMVAEFFRRAGWNLCTGPFSSHQELTSLVHNHWFDIVGFSVSSDRRLDELQKGIHNIRRASRNRNVGIILGGPAVIAQPGLVASMGADMMSADATAAPQQALSLIERMKSQN